MTVPILALTFWGKVMTVISFGGCRAGGRSGEVRAGRIADDGHRRAAAPVRFTLDAAKLSAYGLSPGAVQEA